MRLFVLSPLVLLLGSHIASAAVDSTLLSLVPPSSTVLSGIDIQRATSSRSGSIMLQQTIEGQGLAKLTAAVGLNVRRDFSQILLVGIGQHLTPESRYVLLARGKYNTAHLIAGGKSKGASIRRHGAATVIELGSGNTARAIALLQPGVLVMGDVGMVNAVLTSKTHSGIDSALRDQADQIGPANDVWYATTLSGSFLAQQVGDALPSELRSSTLLERISRSSGGLQFGASDKLTLDLIARSPGDARLVSDVLRLAGRLARLQFGGNAGLVVAGSILSSMRVTVEGSTIHAVSAVPDEQLEQALTSPN